MYIKHGNLVLAAKNREITGIVVHGCNALGVMGAGIAAGIKKEFPEAFRVYKNSPRNLGTVIYYDDIDIVIANAITQQNIGTHKRQVSYDAIATCFEDICDYALHNYISDIHFPKIGAGLAGGNWDAIENIIKSVVPAELNATLWLFEPAPPVVVQQSLL